MGKELEILKNTELDYKLIFYMQNNLLWQTKKKTYAKNANTIGLTSRCRATITNRIARYWTESRQAKQWTTQFHTLV